MAQHNAAPPVPPRSIESSEDHDPSAVEGASGGAVVQQLPLDALDLDDTRYLFRAALRIGPLCKSIQAVGQQVPIIVRKKPGQADPRYQIVSGFRRVTALRSLRYQYVDAIVRDDLEDDEAAFQVAVVENEQRKTYSDIDRALVIHAFEESGYTSVQVAELMGLTRRQKNNLRSLLELPDPVRAAIDDPESSFTATHAITLRHLANRHADLDMEHWVEQVNAQDLSVARLKRAVNREHRVTGHAPLRSIYNRTATDRSRGIFRLSPVKVVVPELTDEDRDQLRSELEELLEALD